jgi:hypothetical protein
MRTIGLVDVHRLRRADAVAVQKEHDLADDLLLCPAGDDALGTLRPNPGHFTQAGRFLIDDVEYRLAKGAHELFGTDGPDASDHTGAEILLDAFDRRT